MTPYVIDSVVGSDGSVLYKGQTESVDLGISDSSINAVRTAMRCVVTGTSSWDSTAQSSVRKLPDRYSMQDGYGGDRI